MPVSLASPHHWDSPYYTLAVKRINWSLGLWVQQGSERTLDSSEGHRKTLNAFQATGESLGIRSLSSTLCPMGGHLTCLYHRVCCEEQRRECLWDWSVNRMYHKCNAHSTKTWLYHPAMLTAGSCLRTQLGFSLFSFDANWGLWAAVIIPRS